MKGSDISRGKRDTHQRGVETSTEADGGDRRQTDSVAHHAPLRILWIYRICRVLWLQGTYDKGVFCQLLSA